MLVTPSEAYFDVILADSFLAVQRGEKGAN